MTPPCLHTRRCLYKVIIGDGREQLTERCGDCGVNPNPGRPWLPRSALGCRRMADVPLLCDLRQRGPFEEGGGP
jgi:hypothetical protein